MVHLEHDAVGLDGIRDFFERLSFNCSCSERSGGGPLMIIHGDQRVNRFKKSKLGLDADQELDPKLLGSIPGGSCVGASATFGSVLQITYRMRRDNSVRAQKGTSKDGPLGRAMATCSWKNPKNTACPGA